MREPRNDTGGWAVFTRWVLRRPLLVLAAAAGVLVLLALPLTSVQWGFIDERWLPVNDPQRAAMERVRDAFPAVTSATPLVALPDTPPGSPAGERLAAKVSRMRHVVSVSAPDGRGRDGVRTALGEVTSGRRTAPGRGIWFEVSTDVASGYSAEAKGLVRALRALGPEVPGGRMLVGGETAELMDAQHTLVEVSGLAAVGIGLAVGVLLLVYTGSAFIPVKALAMNLLSMTAGFGAMVLLFQEGYLARWLGGTATGVTDPLLPPLVFCIVFGLSMDYEVFLVGRIREEYRRGVDNRTAVTTGLRRTGRLVTASCLAMIAAVLPLALSSLAVMQLLGTVLIISVAVDATVVRCLLVPATMVLAGRWNWWPSAHGRRSDPVPPSPVDHAFDRRSESYDDGLR
ncbi:MMPL family transporter [Streptomyces sp. RGM 3693]|uniref:MMPL family transporter n=1 Tax=Streptomyces sp. RGM 3693 TaxID=3413284 RepID=UPI003D2B981C